MIARKPVLNELIINEVLARTDTATATGDANRDGDATGQRDEFVEIVNRTSAPLNLSGLRLYDNTTTTRHIFPANTILQPGKAIVVFWRRERNCGELRYPGYLPDGVDSRTATVTNSSFGGAIVQVASTFSFGGANSALGLNDTGTPADFIRIVGWHDITSVSPVTVTGTLIAEASFPASTVSSRSFTRNDDLLTGETGGTRNFAAGDTHPLVNNGGSVYNGRQYSPGFRRDGITSFDASVAFHRLG